MGRQTSILCPVDFSEPSHGALRYAAFLAEHLGGEVLAVTVEDPLVAEAHTLGSGVRWRADETRAELREFAAGVLDPSSTPLDCVVTSGKAAPEILRVARERACDVIVMSRRGVTGMRKQFFGSTTERVLRETDVPVLVTPPTEGAALTVEGVAKQIQRILVPIDFASDASHLIRATAFTARALALPVLLVHVIEPVRSAFAARLRVASVDAERRARAEEALTRLSAELAGVRAEGLVVYGDPAEELAKVAHDRLAGLIVVGQHGSPVSGPRMGSVTFRILCLTSGLVLAIPPRATEAGSPEVARSLACPTEFP